jgi:4-amino-4-deoxy-L-arabinose transferase-like glycosyltransferase
VNAGGSIGALTARVRGALAGSPESARRSDGFWMSGVALFVRLPWIGYAASRFPPADDGAFYHVVAERIARGLGYTWLWPDGAVTYAAHYPVGYPALMGAFYAVFGARPGVAMLLNALCGALAVLAVHALASGVASRRGALIAAAFAAFLPGLLLYTPALMTEAVAGDFLVMSAAVAGARRLRPWTALLFAGLLLGVALLLRPQLVLVAPAIGLLTRLPGPSWRSRVNGILGVTCLSLLLCLPWTLRNCQRLDRCAFVSANGGWNLYIGSSALGRGGWAPIEQIGVPAACRNVFGEGEKDRCFGQAGLERIAADPAAWLGLVPRKLGMTFDYGTASAHYLSASNGAVVGETQKLVIGGAELLGQRVLLLFGIVALARMVGPRQRARRIVAVLAAIAALSPAGYLGWLGLLALALLAGDALLRHPPALVTFASVFATALTHAIFFGASRYALVCLPPLAALAGCLWSSPLPVDETPGRRRA